MEPEPPTTDFSLLEPHKENISQRTGGVSAKSEALRFSSSAPVESSLDALVAAVANSGDSDDPLAAHVALLSALSAQNKAKQHAKVLENAARAFRKDARYANDVRFVSLWIQVAKKAPEPEDVFVYLESNNIGQKCALFYEEYALLLEQRRKFKLADKVYAKAIKKDAAPLDRLKRKYQAFQHRMMVPKKKQKQDEDEDNEDNQIQREYLGPSASHIPPPKPHHAPSTSLPSSAYASYSSFGSSKPVVASKPTSNVPAAKLAVFKDSDAFAKDAPTFSNQQPWSDYGTRDSQIKENTMQPESWNRAMPAVSSSKAGLGRGRLDVFADETADVSTSIRTLLTEHSTTPPKPTRKPLPSNTAAATPPIHAPPLEHHLKPQFNLSQIYHRDREFSFEELRAMKMPKPIAPPASPPMREASPVAVATAPTVFSDPVVAPVSQPIQGQESLGAVEDDNSANPFHHHHHHNTSSSSTTHFDSSDEEDEDAEADRELERLTSLNTLGNKDAVVAGQEEPFSRSEVTASGGGGFTNKSKAVASPTINTKAALRDVYEMFNAGVVGGGEMDVVESRVQRVEEEESDCEGEGEDGHEVVAVKNGLDDKPEWVEIEADETISRQVIQPQSSGLKSSGMFVDSENATSIPFRDPPAAAARTKLAVFNDENAPAPPMKRKPLGAKPLASTAATAKSTPPPVMDVQSPFFHDDTNSPSTSTMATANQPSSPTTTRGEYQIPVFTAPKPRPTLPSVAPDFQSTPHNQQQHFLSDSSFSQIEDSDLEDLRDHQVQFSHTATSSSSRAVQMMQRGLMTPITETSFEYSTSSVAMSTIGSVRYADFTTMGGRMSGVTGVMRESFGGSGLMRRVDGGEGLSLSSINGAGGSSGGVGSVEVVEEEGEGGRQGAVDVLRDLTMRCVDGLGEVRDEADKEDDQEVDSVMPVVESSPEEPTHTSNDNDTDGFQIPNPCNPHSVPLQHHLMTSHETLPRLQEMTGYMDLSRLPTSPRIGTALDDAVARVPLGGGICEICVAKGMYVRFRMVKKLGEGRFVARELKSGLMATSPILDEEQELEIDDEEEEQDADDEETSAAVPATFLLCLQQPPNPWEFYCLQNLHARVPERITTSIAHPVSCHVFSDASCMRTRISSETTLTAALSRARKHGYAGSLSGPEGGVDELLCAFWTVEMLRSIEAFHVSGILHLGIALDTVLVRLDRGATLTGDTGFWDALYDVRGGGGWGGKGVQVVGFERAVDLFAFEAEQGFLGVEGKYEKDWGDVAGVVHWLVFGREVEVRGGEGGRKEVVGEVKRSWEVEMWDRVFDVLLNLGKARKWEVDVDAVVGRDEEFAELVAEFEAVVYVRDVRVQLEKWLVRNCCKGGKSLKSMLQRVEMGMLE
ncbi:hypothetical protein HDU98_008428 [Podochytrium sp. JEL0797]|nr:hypothetical protein HDU98_008428 [Podochytrium sp. JEL0797]